jgi:voltage-gated potassium channel
VFVHETSMGDAQHLLALERGLRHRLMLRTIGRALLITGAALTLYYLLPLERESTVTLVVTTAIGVVVTAGVAVWQVGAVARSRLPQLRAVEAVVTVAALAVVVFAGTYLGMSKNDTAAFSEPLDHTGALYFTMTTLATIGYGDIAPRTNPGRIAVMLQMVVNVAVLGAAVKVLAGTARSRLRGSRPVPPSEGPVTGS